MPEPSFWSRIKNAPVFRVLAIGLVVTWVILQVVSCVLVCCITDVAGRTHSLLQGGRSP